MSEQVPEPAVEPVSVVAPAAATNDPALPDPGGLIGDGFKFAWRRFDLVWWSLLVQLGIFAAAATIIGLGFGITMTFGATPSAGLMVLFGIIGLLVVIAMVVVATLNGGAMIYAAAATDDVRYWDGWRWAYRNFWSLVWLGVLSTLVILPAALFFFVPALVVGIYLSFAYYVLIAEERRGLDTLVRSTQLVHGNWWGVLGRVLLLVLVGAAVGFVVSFVVVFVFSLVGAAIGLGASGGGAEGALGGGLLAAGLSEIVRVPFDIIVQMFLTVLGIRVAANMYRSMRDQKPAFDPSAKSSSRTWYTVLAWLGIPALILFSVAIAGMVASLDGMDERQYSETEWTMPETPSAASTVTDSVYRSQVNGILPQAEIYFNAIGNGSYEGVCNSRAVSDVVDQQDNVTCNDTAAGYAVATELSDGSYYCYDSTGYIVMTAESLGAATTCPVPN